MGGGARPPENRGEGGQTQQCRRRRRPRRRRRSDQCAKKERTSVPATLGGEANGIAKRTGVDTMMTKGKGKGNIRGRGSLGGGRREKLLPSLIMGRESKREKERGGTSSLPTGEGRQFFSRKKIAACAGRRKRGGEE